VWRWCGPNCCHRLVAAAASAAAAAGIGLPLCSAERVVGRHRLLSRLLTNSFSTSSPTARRARPGSVRPGQPSPGPFNILWASPMCMLYTHWAQAISNASTSRWCCTRLLLVHENQWQNHDPCLWYAEKFTPQHSCRPYVVPLSPSDSILLRWERYSCKFRTLCIAWFNSHSCIRLYIASR